MTKILLLKGITEEDWNKATEEWKKWVLKCKPGYCREIDLDDKIPTEMSKVKWSDISIL